MLQSERQGLGGGGGDRDGDHHGRAAAVGAARSAEAGVTTGAVGAAVAVKSS